jgi:nucleotide-binding universal stress UspA family protein
MSGLKTFLVPTDFAAAAETALDVAIDLATKVRAEVYLMHAARLPYAGYPDGISFPTNELVSRIVAKAESELAACLARRRASGVEIKLIFKQIDPREAVLEAADEISADLLIMGTHGRRGLERALMGSVAESVARTSERPVMTVHASGVAALDGTAPPAASPSPRSVVGPFQHILVPTDFSAPSERALGLALELARISDARITLLHVWSLPKFGYAEGLSWPIDGLETAARNALEGVRASTLRVHAKTDALLREGNEATQIMDTTKTSNIDLVVMGTHGRRGLPRLMLGSVAGEVIRLCPVPVVTTGLAK